MTKKFFFAAGSLAALGCQQVVAQQPNIIYIITDQQSASMLSCAGNPWLKTPAMDYLAENGIRFTRAYAANPVSSPSRVCMISGRFPGYFKDQKGKTVRENSGASKVTTVSEEVKQTNLAAWLQKAGYDLHYGGKQHLPPPLSPKTLGFNVLTQDSRDKLATTSAEFIREQHDKPYFLIVSLTNPHDICHMAIRDYEKKIGKKGELKGGEKQAREVLDKALLTPKGVSQKEFFARYCPPLPFNYEPQQDEPQAIDWLINLRPFRKNARDNYSDENWRIHRWAYCRLTEIVDKQIQIVLDALKASGQEDNTLVIFSSDHGDMDASHRMEHKTVLYEESVNIPFIAMWKGKIPAAQVDSIHLVSNGLDLLPTVCDYAGIKGVADSRGRSLRPLFEGEKTDWRNSLGIESQIGHAVISADKYKYIQYDAVGVEERLSDMNRDPYETTHITALPEYTQRLNELRQLLKEWFPSTKK